MEHEINMIGGSLQSSFLNRDEYEQQVAINQIYDQDYEMVDQPDQNQQDGQQRRGYDLRSKFIPAKQVTKPNAARKPLKLAPPIIDPAPPDNQNFSPMLQQKQNSAPNIFAENRVGLLSFNFESELRKIKVPIPLTKLVKYPMQKNSFAKILQPSQIAQDTVNLQDGRPQIFISNLVESKNDENPPAFYLS